MPYVVEMGGELGAKRGPDGVHMRFGPLWWGRTLCVRSVESYCRPPRRMVQSAVMLLPPWERVPQTFGSQYHCVWL